MTNPTEPDSIFDSYDDESEDEDADSDGDYVSRGSCLGCDELADLDAHGYCKVCLEDEDV